MARPLPAFLLALLFALAPLAAPGQETGFALDPVETVAASRAAIGGYPDDFRMRDRSGRERRLSEFRGRPLLVNFIYTGCFEVCPTSSRALRRAVLAMRKRFGDQQFQVLSIGFDQPTDSPAALRDFAARQRIDDANWEFLAPRAEDIERLAKDFGFRFQRTPIGYEHTLQVSILDAEGRLRQQVYGDAFGPESLGEPLKQMLTGALVGDTRGLGDFLERIRILCSVYDPTTGEYRADYALYMQLAGGLCFILCMLVFAVQEWRRQRRLAAPP